MSNALTPEEWRYHLASKEGVYWSDQLVALGRAEDATGVGVLAANGALFVTYDSAVCAVEVPQAERHAIAALALRDQPFGFTWDDVDALRYYADQSIEDDGPFGEGWTSDETAKAQSTCRSLADRIAALLPPR